MLVHNLNPIIAEIGPFSIRWYGLMYVIGFIFMYYMLLYLVKRKKINLNKNDVEAFVLLIMACVLAGARIFEVFVYYPSYYFANPSKMIAIWQGGLSFHGGLLGAVIAVIIFCKWKKVKFLQMADLVAIPIGIPLALGRAGNFINGELYGRITNLPWCMKFPDAEGCRHPSQLYEMFKNITIFGVMWSLKDRKKPEGWYFAIFLILYGVLRFTVEFVREPGVFVGPITMGQFLSLIMIFSGAWLFNYIKK